MRRFQAMLADELWCHGLFRVITASNACVSNVWLGTLCLDRKTFLVSKYIFTPFWFILPFLFSFKSINVSYLVCKITRIIHNSEWRIVFCSFNCTNTPSRIVCYLKYSWLLLPEASLKHFAKLALETVEGRTVSSSVPQLEADYGFSKQLIPSTHSHTADLLGPVELLDTPCNSCVALQHP